MWLIIIKSKHTNRWLTRLKNPEMLDKHNRVDFEFEIEYYLIFPWLTVVRMENQQFEARIEMNFGRLMRLKLFWKSQHLRILL